MIQKLAGDQLRSLQYEIHASECFSLDPISYPPKPRPLSDSDDEPYFTYDAHSVDDGTPTMVPQRRQDVANPNFSAERPGYVTTDAFNAQASPLCHEPSRSSTPPVDSASQNATDGLLSNTPSPEIAAPDHHGIQADQPSSDVFIPRRGTRTRRPPDRFGDCVTHFEEDEEEEEAVTPGS